MKKLFIITMLLSALALAQPYPIRLPSAAPCDVGVVPAATLLVPYFEVDSSNPAGLDTLVGVTNIGDWPIVAHVVVWNVDSFPVFDFNIYLTEYDVVTFSMRNILVNGNMPNNTCVWNPGQPNHHWYFIDGAIDCSGNGAYFLDGTTADNIFSASGYAMDIACYSTIGAATLSNWQCKLTIGSYDFPTDNYVGYVTIDTSITCNGALPNNPDYFLPNYLDTEPIALPDGVGDHSVIENSNVLIGDILYYDNVAMVSDGVPAVHMEAFGEDCTATGHNWGMQSLDNDVLNIPTFWNKYLGPYAPAILPATDHREALPLRWAFRYIGEEAFDGGTWVDVWRSGTDNFGWFLTPGPCSWAGVGNAYTVIIDIIDNPIANIDWYDLGMHRPPIIVYDEEENTTTGGGPSPPPQATIDILRAETQRVSVNDEFPLFADNGWIGLYFDTDYLYDYPPPAGTFNGVTGNTYYDQSWVNVRYSALNKYTAGLTANAWLSNCVMFYNVGAGTFGISQPIHP